MGDIIDRLTKPLGIFRRNEVIGKTSVVPPKPGVYAWYFRSSPSPLIQLRDCWNLDGWHLLYVGISPSGHESKNNLRKRIRGHMTGNAAGSTLRLSLGCLLAEPLGLQLRRVQFRKKERLTFWHGEDRLSTWLEDNAAVCWVEHCEPWAIETKVIEQLYLPINLDMNECHPFHSILSASRSQARQIARQLPVVSK